MRLALGTVQFGMNYGAFNAHGQPKTEAIAQILDHAAAIGVTTLDTAQAYGESERLLGALKAAERFQIITKIQRPNPVGVTAMVSESLSRLGASPLYGVMLHNAGDLLGDDGDTYWTELEHLREQGVIRLIGVSVYGPEEAATLLDRYPIGIIQFPMNVFDRRMQTSGVLERLQGQGVECHARSMLLQGFALADPARLPVHLVPFRPLLDRFIAYCEAMKMTRLEAAYGYLAKADISKIVVGVDSYEQLHEIGQVAQIEREPLDEMPEIVCENLDLIIPSRWAA